MANATFTWGTYASDIFTDALDSTYSEVVHWRMNLFKVPYGNTGKAFVLELARLFESFAISSALESIAMKATLIFPILLLQKPSRNSKVKDHIVCLERRLKSWKDGDLNDLTAEGRAIQCRIPKSHPPENNERLARSFAQLIFQGKTKATKGLRETPSSR